MRQNCTTVSLVKGWADMFDSVALIVTALSAGATEAGRDAAHDAYEALKASILKKYKPAYRNVQRLERDPGSPVRKEELARSLRKLGAGADSDLTELARNLIEVVEQGSWDSVLDQPRRDFGAYAVGKIMDNHVDRVAALRAAYRMDPEDLIASRLSSSADVPYALRKEVSKLHADIRRIIEQVALNIESGKYRETEAMAGTLPSLKEREKAVALVNADKKLRISYETLNLTVSFFSDINAEILTRIESEQSTERQSQMMFGNAITIYELSDFVISFIKDFSPSGSGELNALHAETIRRIDKARSSQQALAASATGKGIEESVRTGILEDVRNREKALQILREEWGQYMEETQQFHKRIGEVHGKIPTLQLIRENARVQLEVLELVSMLRFLQQNADAVRSTVETLQGFRLAPLTPARVRRLLGPT